MCGELVVVVGRWVGWCCCGHKSCVRFARLLDECTVLAKEQCVRGELFNVMSELSEDMTVGGCE